VAGVTVTDGTRTAISNSNGLYVITNVPAGDYVIQPSKEGFSFSPASMNVAVPPNASGRDFKPQ
jgi:inhibitor of cysteine peptidase